MRFEIKLPKEDRERLVLSQLPKSYRSQEKMFGVKLQMELKKEMYKYLNYITHKYCRCNVKRFLRSKGIKTHCYIFMGKWLKKF